MVQGVLGLGLGCYYLQMVCRKLANTSACGGLSAFDMLEPEEQVSVLKLSTSSKPSVHGLDASGAFDVREEVHGLWLSTMANDS